MEVKFERVRLEQKSSPVKLTELIQVPNFHLGHAFSDVHRLVVPIASILQVGWDELQDGALEHQHPSDNSA
eukprot:756732-Hanusia_phi.AAC.5